MRTAFVFGIRWIRNSCVHLLVDYIVYWKILVKSKIKLYNRVCLINMILDQCKLIFKNLLKIWKLELNIDLYKMTENNSHRWHIE